MITPEMVIQFLGGLGLFFYGMNRLSDGLQKLAANKLKKILQSFTKTTMRASLFGVILTVALQSSAASTVMIVEFVNAGFMTLTQGLNVALSSALGTYVLLQLISFPMLPPALLMIFLGALPLFVVKTAKARKVGQILVGFGCIFVGISYMSGSFLPLKDIPEVYLFLHKFGTVPLLGILAGLILAALMQSSSVFLAIVISMATQGLISTEAIIALVVGAHIGGTLTTLAASVSAEQTDAKRVAFANSFYRVAAAVILYPFFFQFANLVEWLSPSAPGAVALAYLLSTLFMVIIFLPFNKPFARLLTRMIPEKRRREDEFHFYYINKSSLAVPAIALNQTYQEIRWLGVKILENMFELIPRALISGGDRWQIEIAGTARQVEWHYAEIVRFLAGLFNGSVTRQQIMDSHHLQRIAFGWKEAARNLDLVEQYIRRSHPEREFTEHEWDYFDRVYGAVSSLYLKVLQVLEQRDPQTIGQLMEEQRQMALLKEDQIKLIFYYEGEKSAPGINEMFNICNYLFIVGDHLRIIGEMVEQRL